VIDLLKISRKMYNKLKMNRLTEILINLPDFRENGKLENPLFRLFSELNNFSTINENEIQSNSEKTLLPKTKIVFSG